MSGHHDEAEAASRVRLWPLGLAQFCGITALFTHVALTSVVAQTWIDAAANVTITTHGADGHDNVTTGAHPDAIPRGVATLPLSVLILCSAIAIPPAGWVMQHVGYRKVFYAGTLLGALSGGLCILAVVLHDDGTLSPVGSFVLLAAAIVPQGVAYGIVHYYRHVAAVVGKLAAARDGLTATQATARAVAVVISSGALAGVVGPGLADLCNGMIPNYRFAGSYGALIVVSFMHTAVLCLTDVDAAFGPAAPPASPAATAGSGGTASHTPLLVASGSAGGSVVNNGSIDEKPPAPPAPPPPRPLREIVTSAPFATAMLTAMAAHGCMVAQMGVAPLLLHGKVTFTASSAVIQVHVLCMYLPSFGTSKLIARFHTAAVIVAGLVLGVAGAGVLLLAGERPNLGNDDRDASSPPWGYYAMVMACLVLVGLGWNLAFVAATTAVAGAYQASEKFKAQSVNDFCVFGFGSMMTLLAGPILEKFHLRVVAVAALVIYGVAILGNIPSVLQHRRDAARAASASAAAAGSTEPDPRTPAEELPTSHKSLGGEADK